MSNEVPSEMSDVNKKIQLRFTRSKVTVEFIPTQHETILDAALEAGVAVAYDCCSGFDGVCQVRCSGKTKYLQEPSVDVDEDSVLVCIAVPLTDVELDL